MQIYVKNILMDLAIDLMEDIKILEIYRRITFEPKSKKTKSKIKISNTIQKYIRDNKYKLTYQLSKQIFDKNPQVSEQLNEHFQNPTGLYNWLKLNKNIKLENELECSICMGVIPNNNYNTAIELVKCNHVICFNCFIKIKLKDKITCPFCRLVQDSKYLIASSDKLEDLFLTKYKTLYPILIETNCEYWKIICDTNILSDQYAYMLIEQILQHNDFATKSVKIDNSIIEKINLFERFEMHEHMIGNELIVKKLLRLGMSREDFLEIIFYKSCIKLGWIY